jgi:hypothetical protein
VSFFFFLRHLNIFMDPRKKSRVSPYGDGWGSQRNKVKEVEEWEKEKEKEPEEETNQEVENHLFKCYVEEKEDQEKQEKEKEEVQEESGKEKEKSPLHLRSVLASSGGMWQKCYKVGPLAEGQRRLLGYKIRGSPLVRMTVEPPTVEELIKYQLDLVAALDHALRQGGPGIAQTGQDS